MYRLSDQQVDYVLADIQRRGVKMEDLQNNLLDHVCCMLENSMQAGDEFEKKYEQTIQTFFRKELSEIEDETIHLLTYKNYYAMKKALMITGTFSVCSFIMGTFFKTMHWPGANVLLVSGIASLSFLFLPLFFLVKTKESGSIREKIVFAAGTILGLLYCMAVLSLIMHWKIGKPGTLWIVTCAFAFFVFVPLYFFSGIRKPEKKLNTIVVSILVIVAAGLHFTLVNLRPTNPEIKMYGYLQNEQLLEKMSSSLVQPSKPYSAHRELVTAIHQRCNDLKGMILASATGVTTMPEDIEKKNLLIEENNLGNVFNGNPSANNLFADLKRMVIKYNAENNAGKIPVEHSILEIQPDRLSSYSNLFFLTELTQLQMFLVHSENMQIAAK